MVDPHPSPRRRQVADPFTDRRRGGATAASPLVTAGFRAHPAQDAARLRSVTRPRERDADGSARQEHAATQAPCSQSAGPVTAAISPPAMIETPPAISNGRFTDHRVVAFDAAIPAAHDLESLLRHERPFKHILD